MVQICQGVLLQWLKLRSSKKVGLQLDLRRFWIAITIEAIMIAGKPLTDVVGFGAVAGLPLASILGF